MERRGGPIKARDPGTPPGSVTAVTETRREAG